MSDLDGIYTDPFHSPIGCGANVYSVPAPWFGGLRVLVPRGGPGGEGGFLAVGCDDGIHFWILSGKYVDDGKIEMDFAPKVPGVGLLQCRYEPGALSFLEPDGVTVGNTWSRLACDGNFEIAPLAKHGAFNEINGMYFDPSIYAKGSFAGLRIVSDRVGKWIVPSGGVVVVGTDDGTSWRVMSEDGGGAGGEDGSVDFGGEVGKGTIKNGDVELASGSKWTKVGTKTDFRVLPKGK